MGDSHLQPSVLDLNFIRPGSLNLTQRAPDQLPQWASDEVRTIEVSLGLTHAPLLFRVRRFVPAPGDALTRTWISPDGQARSTPLAPYALVDPGETSRHIQEYFRDNCMCFPNAVRNSHPAVRKVYAEVEKHLAELRAVAAISGPEHNDTPLRLLETYCELWFGIRNMMGSAWICGSETLGMQPLDEEGYPLRGKVSIPRQVVQIVGCLQDRILKPLQGRFLAELKAALETEGEAARDMFYTIWLLVFVLLHECEDISKDRERYARQNFMTTVFSLPQYMEALHKSARVLIDRWFDFADVQHVNFGNARKLRASLHFLPEAHSDFILRIYDEVIMQNQPPVRANPKTWTKDLCFVTHMFGIPWDREATYDALSDA